MSFLGKLPDTLPFTKADLRLPMAVRKSRRNSISGVQSKVLLSFVDGEFAVVESGGDFILKPVPEDSLSRFAADIPANENLTMEINGATVRQEDLCQIAGRSEETHGESYKYDFSYEEMADLIRMVCPAYRVELPKVFRQIVFDYLFGNGDAHLKNFSVYESALGDYVMTPAYDLLSTMLHYPGDLTFMALSFFKDPDFMTPEFENLGYYSTSDFVALGKAYGLDGDAVCKLLDEFRMRQAQVESMVGSSLLSEEAKKEYLRIFADRLAMFR